MTATVPIPLDHPHSPPSGQITRTLHPQARSPALSTLRPDHPHSPPSGQITRTLHPQARSPALSTLRPDHPHSPPSGQITRTLHPQASASVVRQLHSPPNLTTTCMLVRPPVPLHSRPRGSRFWCRVLQTPSVPFLGAATCVSISNALTRQNPSLRECLSTSVHLFPSGECVCCRVCCATVLAAER